MDMPSEQQYRDWCDEVHIDFKQHQYDGLLWCIRQESSSSSSGLGGIIADEMGLGKTVIALALLHFRPKDRNLIVLPPILISQWSKQIQDILHITPLILTSYHLNKFINNRGLEHEQLQDQDKNNNKKKKKEKKSFCLSDYPVIIVSYGILHKLIHISSWCRVIFDEAHYMRNKTTKQYMAGCGIPSQIKWLLTGTPINNHISDLDSLFHVLNMTSIPIEQLSSKILKRTRDEVHIVLSDIKYHQIHVAWDTHITPIAKLLHHVSTLHDISHCDGNRNGDGMIHFHHDDPIHKIISKGFGNLIRRRQISILPSIIHQKYTEIATDTRPQDISQHTHNIIQPSASSTLSNKLDTVINTVRKRFSQHYNRNKIIFTYFRNETDYLVRRFRDLSFSTVAIDGRVPNKQRPWYIEPVLSKTDFMLINKKWHNKFSFIYDLIVDLLTPKVLILQIQTCCEGLNLQHFSEIYFTSTHWNPAVEQQAVARCHRIGQKHKVDVFRFIMGNFEKVINNKVVSISSIDNTCINIQNEKLELYI